MYKKLTFISLNLFLLSIIFLLYTKILHKNNEGLSLIKKENFNFFHNDNLKYFYEPKANSIIFDHAWIKHDGKAHINEDTLNERYNYPIERSPNIFRIIALGDSFTYGLYVDTKDNWVEQLEDDLNSKHCLKVNKFEVINLGVQGYDPQYTVERYKRRGIKYRPDLILWLLVKNDMLRINELTIPLADKYTVEMKKLGQFDYLVQHSNPYPAWRLAMETVIKKYGEAQILNHQIDQFRKLDDYYHGPLLIFALPNIANEDSKLIANFIRTKKNGYFFDSITDIYKERDMYFFGNGHPTKQGYKEIEKSLVSYLFYKNIIPCN